jgi:probable rRNA maturation factor
MRAQSTNPAPNPPIPRPTHQSHHVPSLNVDRTSAAIGGMDGSGRARKASPYGYPNYYRPMHLDLDLQLPEDTPELAQIPWTQWFQQWLTQLDPLDPDDGLPLHRDRRYELCLRLTTDAEIQTLNHQYRNQDQPTDVLAFAALEVDVPPLEDEAEPLYLGDIVISVETADRQAAEQHHPIAIELAWLATHGLLHLLGWDHPDEAQLIAMLAQQRALLQSAAIIP